MSPQAARQSVIDHLTEVGTGPAVVLKQAIDARYAHSEKCTKRNVNECKKCLKTYDGVRDSFTAATKSGIELKFGKVLDASMWLRG